MKLRLIFHHSEQVWDGSIKAVFEVVGHPKFTGCCLTIGRPRLKVHYHVLKNISRNPDRRIFATLRHTDWSNIQYHLSDPRTASEFIKVPTICIGTERMTA